MPFIDLFGLGPASGSAVGCRAVEVSLVHVGVSATAGQLFVGAVRLSLS